MTRKAKVVLLDVDGLILRGRTRLFSERLAAQQGIPLEAVSKFFENDFKSCSFGQADLKQVIAPYLPEWKWRGTVEDLLFFWFSDEGTVDQDVLDIVGDLRTSDVQCYIATRQEKYRMRFLLDILDLRRHFDGYFCTCEIGCDKSDSQFFQYILDKLGLRAEDTLFFDDKQVNVDVARNLGINAYFYDDIEVLKREVGALLV